MATDISLSFGNKICRWLAGHPMPDPPDALWLAIYNGDPKTSGVEVTALINGYGRILLMPDSIAEGLDNTLVNVADVDFGLSENSLTATHGAIFDAVFGGTRLLSDAFVSGPISPEAGARVNFPAGNIAFTLGS